MPTPQQYAGQSGAIHPMDGLVPGLTWDQFIQGFNQTPNSAFGSNANGVTSYNAGFGQYGGGAEGGSGAGGFGSNGPTNMQYAQEIGDGTQNMFSQDPTTGGVMSHNQTINSDSWWDSTGLPLVASLAFGGATAGLSAAGVGYTGEAAAAGAGGGIGEGALSYGVPDTTANFASIGADGASVAPEFGTGAAQGAAQGAAAPSWLDQIGNYYNNLSGLEKFGVGTLGSQAVSGLAGSGGGDNSFSSLTGGTGGTGGIDYGSAGSTDSLGSGGGNWLSNLFGNGPSAGQLLQGGGSILNSILGSNAANKAADAQTNAANQSNQLAALIYGNNTAMNQPFVNAGTGAVNKMADLNGLNGSVNQGQAAQGFVTSDPGYQFRMDQGNKAVANSSAAAGGLYSGRAFKDAQNYAQGAASQEYGNAYNRLSGLAGIGQASANQQAANGNAYSNAFGSNMGAIGNAQAAGQIGSTNAITGSIGGLMNSYSQNQMMQMLLNNRNSNGYY
jgi:hypothetical protein